MEGSSRSRWSPQRQKLPLLKASHRVAQTLRMRCLILVNIALGALLAVPDIAEWELIEREREGSELCIRAWVLRQIEALLF